MAAPDPGGARAVYPDGRDSQGAGWNHVVIDALGDVKPLAWGDGGALLRQLEHRQGRFVGSGLLGGDHVVEGYLQAAGGVGEKSSSTLEMTASLYRDLSLCERRDRVGERQPVGERFGQRT